MTWLLIVAGILTVIIVAAEKVCWSLFRKKTEPLHFPKGSNFPGSRPFHPTRLRLFALIHSIALLAFTWSICLFLWW